MDAKAIVESQLLQAAQTVEEHLDAEINRLEKIGEDDLERLRQVRLEQLKKQNEEKKDWLTSGHGEYSELPEEREFFNVSKRSQRVVCQFFTESSMNCKIVDKHMKILATKHLETKFCKINAEKTPFLVQKLGVKMIPTIVSIKDGLIIDYIRGFDPLGGRDDFPTEMLEWRLATTKIINYAGDLTVPPGSKKTAPSITGVKPKSKNKKNIRGVDSDSEDENDW